MNDNLFTRTSCQQHLVPTVYRLPVIYSMCENDWSVS